MIKFESNTTNTTTSFYIDNRGNNFNPDDTFTSVLSSLAGTFKDITESPYFPRMAFKKLPTRIKI